MTYTGPDDDDNGVPDIRQVDFAKLTTYGLYQNRNRTYAPVMGRFLQRDPNATGQVTLSDMGWFGGMMPPSPWAGTPDVMGMYGDGMSLHAALGSNPLSKFDASGLDFSMPSISVNMTTQAQIVATNASAFGQLSYGVSASGYSMGCVLLGLAGFGGVGGSTGATASVGIGAKIVASLTAGAIVVGSVLGPAYFDSTGGYDPYADSGPSSELPPSAGGNGGGGCNPNNGDFVPPWVKNAGTFVNFCRNLERDRPGLTTHQVDAIVRMARQYGVYSSRSASSWYTLECSTLEYRRQCECACSNSTRLSNAMTNHTLYAFLNGPVLHDMPPRQRYEGMYRTTITVTAQIESRSEWLGLTELYFSKANTWGLYENEADAISLHCELKHRNYPIHFDLIRASTELVRHESSAWSMLGYDICSGFYYSLLAWSFSGTANSDTLSTCAKHELDMHNQKWKPMLNRHGLFDSFQLAAQCLAEHINLQNKYPGLFESSSLQEFKVVSVELFMSPQHGLPPKQILTQDINTSPRSSAIPPASISVDRTAWWD